MLKVLLATNNTGKVREYSRLLNGLPVDLFTPAQAGIRANVEETGSSIRENAIQKAVTYCSLSKMITLADDSGLEVDALGGEPGVRSARYAGEGATDKQRVDFLLSKLAGVPWEKRTAQFRCVIALATGGGEVKLFEGVCKGVIALEPKGDNGFGYDPIFYLSELGQTMAQIPAEMKDTISHRAQAARQARPVLESLALSWRVAT